MQELELTWQRILSIWWLLIWRAALGGFAIGFAIGLVIGVIAFVIGHRPGFAFNFGVGLVIGLVWWPFVIRMALQKEYKGFRIALLPPQTAPGG